MTIIFMLFFHKLPNFICRYGVLLSMALLIVITIYSLTPITEEPTQNGWDKVMHIFAYLCFSFPISVSYYPRTKYIALFTILWGAGIECIQPFFGRQADIIDAFSNALGSYLGIALASLVVRILCTNPSRFDE